jgi:glutathione peroxidase-family protein
MKQQSVYDFKVTMADGKIIELSQFRNQVLVIVNVASQCGLNVQYEGLESLQKKYASQGFTVLAFPCNQFGGQEPGTDAEIQNFCQTKYAVSFPVMKKVEVNGDNAEPLFTFLKKEQPGLLNTEAIKWNYTKFLVDKSGRVRKRYAPTTTPEAIESDIVNLLK